MKKSCKTYPGALLLVEIQKAFCQDLVLVLVHLVFVLKQRLPAHLGALSELLHRVEVQVSWRDIAEGVELRREHPGLVLPGPYSKLLFC
jgi:hypothetical protein